MLSKKIIDYYELKINIENVSEKINQLKEDTLKLENNLHAIV